MAAKSDHVKSKVSLTDNVVSYCPIFCIFCDFWCIFTICSSLWIGRPRSTIRHNMQTSNPIYRLISDLTAACCCFLPHNTQYWACRFRGSKISAGRPKPIIVCNSEVFFIFGLFCLPMLLISVYRSRSTAWTLCFLGKLKGKIWQILVTIFGNFFRILVCRNGFVL